MTVRTGQHVSGLRAVASTVIAACLAIAAAIFSAAVPSEYVGDSFLQIPGVNGGWPGEKYRNWIRVDASYWESDPASLLSRRSRKKADFSVSPAPREGADALVISVDKHSPALAPLLDACAKKMPIPEVMYAESSARARALGQIGPRPAEIPEYYEYKLKE